MRLIDADTLKAGFAGNFFEMYHYTAIRAMIDVAPTINAGMFYKWKNPEEETPDSSRHIIIADGEIISKYAYYSKPKNKWYTDWHCDTEIPTPRMWTEMPDVPEESIIGDCCCG